MSDNAHGAGEGGGHGDGGHGGGGGGGGKGHGKKHHPAHAPHEEHEEGWIVSFADNVLLQMGFFVILLALNIGPKGGGVEGDGDGSGAPGTESVDARMMDFAIEVRSAFNSPLDINSKNPADAPLIRRLKERRGKADDGVSSEKGDVDRAQHVRPGLPSSLGAVISFDDNAATISAAAKGTLEETAAKLQGSRSMVEVRGHASAAESRRDPRVARDLSYARAYSAAELLVESGMVWRQLRVVSAGETDPALPRATTRTEHRGNQRVEIVVLEEITPPDEFTEASAR